MRWDRATFDGSRVLFFFYSETGGVEATTISETDIQIICHCFLIFQTVWTITLWL